MKSRKNQNWIYKHLTLLLQSAPPLWEQSPKSVTPRNPLNPTESWDPSFKMTGCPPSHPIKSGLLMPAIPSEISPLYTFFSYSPVFTPVNQTWLPLSMLCGMIHAHGFYYYDKQLPNISPLSSIIQTAALPFDIALSSSLFMARGISSSSFRISRLIVPWFYSFLFTPILRMAELINCSVNTLF